MIEIDQALKQIMDHALPTQAERVPLSRALGRYLAADVVSDIDSPPYDKSMMDGYAVRAEDVSLAGTVLDVIEEVTAGEIPQQRLIKGTATRIMTGAPIPEGADAVVMVERTERVDDDSARPGLDKTAEKIRILASDIKADANIIRQAVMMQCGQTVLSAATKLSAIHVGLLAEAGAAEVAVCRSPTVSVLATGDELVTPDQSPGPGQIRNSNGPMLSSMASDLGVDVQDLGIARDCREELAAKIGQGLASDMLILSGGVSAGVLDLVPGVLADCGVRQVFHKVKVKPGKPIWFGVLDADDRQRLVFGLPGNPVSSLVCFQMFVRPAIRRMAGQQVDEAPPQKAVLAASHQHRGDRPTLWPARLHRDGIRVLVEPLNWKGSADLCTLGSATGLVRFAGETRRFDAGETVTVYPF